VQRHGVVDGVADLLILQVINHTVARGGAAGRVRDADDVLVVDHPVPGRHVRRDDGGVVGESFVVVGGVVAASLVPVFQVGQFGEDDGGLDGVESEVPPDVLMVILWFGAMIAQDGEHVRKFFVVGDDHASVADRAEVLRREEREASAGAHGAGLASVVGGADGLGGVLDDGDVPIARRRQDRVHVGTLAEQVHRHDGLRPVGHGGRETRGVQVVRLRVDVHEDGPGAEAGHASGRREEGERRGDDLVAWPDAETHESVQDGVRAARGPDAERGVGVLGDGLFAVGHLRSADAPLCLEDLVDGGVDFVADGIVLGYEVEHGHGHVVSPWLWVRRRHKNETRENATTDRRDGLGEAYSSGG